MHTKYKFTNIEYLVLGAGIKHHGELYKASEAYKVKRVIAAFNRKAATLVTSVALVTIGNKST